MMKAPIHKPAKRKYIKAYLVFLSQVIAANGEDAWPCTVPTLYKNLKEK